MRLELLQKVLYLREYSPPLSVRDKPGYTVAVTEETNGYAVWTEVVPERDSEEVSELRCLGLWTDEGNEVEAREDAIDHAGNLFRVWIKENNVVLTKSRTYVRRGRPQ